jgi:hydrogenase maturation factor
MCESRLHRVVAPPEDGAVRVENVEGAVMTVSLLAYDGPPLSIGDWVVAHSGYALGHVDPVEAEAVVAELALAATRPTTDDRRPTTRG